MSRKTLKSYIPKLQSNLFTVPQLKEIWKRIVEGVENLTPPIVTTLVRYGYESSLVPNQSIQCTPQSYPTSAASYFWVCNQQGASFTKAGNLQPTYSYYIYQDTDKQYHTIYLDSECDVHLAPRMSVLKTYSTYTKVYVSLSTEVLSQLQDALDTGYKPTLKITLPVLQWF